MKAFSASEVIGLGKLCKETTSFIAADLDRAPLALKAETIRSREETALVLGLDNKPSRLNEVTTQLKQARINIICGYDTPSRDGGEQV